VTGMTPAECVRAVAGPVGRLGGAWMFDAGVHARGTELGLDTWAWYHCGRGGVLGNPDPSVVTAAFGFFPPDLQAKAWNKGVAVMDPSAISVEYAAACAAWGTRTFGGVADAGDLADLLTTAVDAAGVMALPLFAGWRAMLHASDGAPGPERLALALQAAREHRGGSHLLAVAAAGIPPLQAVMSGRYGASNAQFFGWPEPWPDPELARDAMAAVETVTDQLVEPAYAALSPEDRTRLAEGLRALPKG
jgi:hypothetical protein